LTRVTGATVGGVNSEISVLRLDFGYFVRPAEETGSTAPRVEPVLGYLVQHPKGTVLLDSGMGLHPDVDDYYRPRRIALPDALHAAGLAVEDLTVVANCHLHFDHCGGNPSLTGLPIVVQEVELAAAHLTDYTLPELVDAPGLTYEKASGDVEIFRGVTVIPTPGHTDGHQSVVVRRGDGSVIVFAGQSHDTATSYSADAFALRASDDGHPPGVDPLAWTPRRCGWVGGCQARSSSSRVTASSQCGQVPPVPIRVQKTLQSWQRCCPTYRVSQSGHW